MILRLEQSLGSAPVDAEGLLERARAVRESVPLVTADRGLLAAFPERAMSPERHAGSG